jgi:eukaryotic-like serine/threonine-protein kinase
MHLARGARVGSYEVVALIGSGGMGEVYRAVDSRLGRSVALKILPDAFSADPDRLARFKREAQVLASLSHSNIGGIYELETEGEVHALVLELVEGPTLADRIAQGALPVDEALGIARQLADALEAAHESGIVHRDLKPANIKLRNDGVVKVLDFGLAKATDPVLSPATSRSSTVTSPAMTQTGVILGTAAYMSPEQALGKQVDRRADIWAFGCVLYEMLTGTKAFRGEVVTETLAAVIRAEPDWTLLPSSTPRQLEALVRRCLRKSVRERLQAIADARIEIDEIRAGEVEPQIATMPAQGPRWKRRLTASLAAVAIALVAGAVAWNLKPAATAQRLVSRQTITLPDGQQLAESQKPTLALAPDDRHLAYVAVRKGEPERLRYLWSFEQGSARLVPGSAGADTPFFSADGQWLGFYNGQNRLMKVPVRGGVAELLLDVVNPFGASWIGERRVAVASLGSVIQEPSDDGRSVKTLTRFDTGETMHQWPSFLPGNRALLFNVMSSSTPGIGVQRFGDDRHRRLIDGADKLMPHYSSSGHVVYAQNGNLMAVPFDLDQLTIPRGAVPTPVLSGVQQIASTPLFSVSSSGSLAYVPGTFQATRWSSLVRIGRDGTELKTFDAPPRYYYQPRVSPDGRRIALDVTEAGEFQVWVYDLVRGQLSPFTYSEDRDNRHALWTLDSKQLLIQSGKEGTRQIFSRPLDGGRLERLTRLASPSSDVDTYTIPSSLCRDGRLLFVRLVPSPELWLLNTVSSSGHVADPVRLDLPMSADGAPQFSPDCRWVAYVLDESGRREVYLRSFPDLNNKRKVSTGGGTEPVWNPDATKQELFYRNGQDMMAVHIDEQGSAVGKIEKLFTGPYATANGGFVRANYDVFPDGSFLMLKPAPQHGPLTQINVVLGWSEEVKRAAPLQAR